MGGYSSAMAENGAGSERQIGRQYSWIALALAAIAGSVDAIGYLLLAHVFTSHMSGNTVALTMHVASGNWREAWRRFEPIVPFFFGIIAGLALTDVLVRLKTRRMFAMVASAELALVIAFFLVAKPPQQWMVALPAAAMGVQNAMLRRVGHHKVRTTYITGMITNTAQGLVDAVTSLLSRDGKAREHFGDFAFYGAIWLSFAGGGITGAVLDERFGSVALLLPIGALAALIAYDVVSPFAA